MELTKNYDKLSLTHLELQKVLKEYIEKETGRKVRGDVYVTCTLRSSRGLENESQNLKVDGSHAHTFLEPKE